MEIRTSIPLVILGDSGVGKTSLRLRFEKFEWQKILEFLEGEKTPLGKILRIYSSSVVREYSWNSRKYVIEWILTDLVGQEYARAAIENALVVGRIALLVYDISRRKTLESLRDWVQSFWKKKEELWKNNARTRKFVGKKAPVVLIGNKIDLRTSSSECVTTEEGSQFANWLSTELGYRVPFIEISAKDSSMNEIDKVLSLAFESYMRWLKIVSKTE